MPKTAHVGSTQLSRRALWLVFGGGIALPASAKTATIIFGNESWYRERPEGEQEWTGVLRKTAPPEGPNTRSALRFTFQSGSHSLAVYAAGVVEKLDRLAGVRVVAQGKRVDLRSEGFGLEFWIGTIRRA